MNRVEHQNEPKRLQIGARLSSFLCSTWPWAETGTDYNVHHVVKSVKRSEPSEHSAHH